MRFQFLSAQMHMTKSYTQTPTGIEKSSYPHAYEFTSHEEDCATLADLAATMNKHAALGHCMLKGSISKPLVSESRAGSTNTQDATQWICLDIDGLPDTDDATAKFTVDNLMSLLGLATLSYVLQWSASYGIYDTYLRCHVIFFLDKPVPAPLVKQWLIHLNHTVSKLRDNQTLTKTGNSLSWPLDITACQNDKLIYIAPPVLKGVKNPMKRVPRISVVNKQNSVFAFPAPVSISANKALTDKRILELRAAAGMPLRKLTYRTVGSIEIFSKPDQCDATDIKTERGFVYFNINGGDSWGYYHPEDNPDYIYNFKGEPTYLTKELLPDYWEHLTTQASRTSSQGITYLAFLDRRSSTYYRGTYEQATDTLELNSAKNETQIRHFAEQNGVPLGSYIPEWDLTFDPHDSVRVDLVNRTINTFQLTEYMRATIKQVAKCPPTIFRVIHHALGSDVDCTVHFINWLSFILQERKRTLTAWVMHGTEGTGKGIMMNRILRPILGKNQTASRRMEELNEPYNAYMKNCFLVFIDEVEAASLINSKGVMAKLRSFITEGTVTVRVMYQTAIEWPNFTNWIFASNKPEPVLIPKEDRRFNVGKYQHKKLGMTDQELERIPGELQAFHDYLMGYPVDLIAAATPLENDDRSNMIAISESSIDTVANHIIDGDFEFLLDQLPATTVYTGNAAMTTKIDDYKHALKTMLGRTDLTSGRCNISRDELRVIFEYVVGKIPESPNKFTSLLKHHRITTTKVRVDDKPVYGIKTTWKDYGKFALYAKTHFPQPAAPATKPAAKAKPTPKAKTK